MLALPLIWTTIRTIDISSDGPCRQAARLSSPSSSPVVRRLARRQACRLPSPGSCLRRVSAARRHQTLPCPARQAHHRRRRWLSSVTDQVNHSLTPPGLHRRAHRSGVHRHHQAHHRVAGSRFHHQHLTPPPAISLTPGIAKPGCSTNHHQVVLHCLHFSTQHHHRALASIAGFCRQSGRQADIARRTRPACLLD